MPKRISPREAHELMAQGYVYLDVRSSPEFQAGHPAGAVHIPLLEMGPGGMQPNPQFVAQVAARYPKDAKLVVGCQGGIRSLRAITALEQTGYTNLVDQRAGFGGARTPTGQIEKGWRDEGLPVETGAAK